MSWSSPYDDAPLLAGEPSTRLLELLDDNECGNTSKLLRFRLHVVQLPSPPRTKVYEALSYVWGDLDATESIELNGRKFFVRPNLHTFLVRHYVQYVRDQLATERGERVASRWLWVDALCINQDDIAERNAQVNLMGRIYNDAKTVLIWLGVLPSGAPSLSISDMTGCIMKRRAGDNLLQQDRAAEAMSKLPEFSPKVSAIREYLDCVGHFFNSTYWRRMWVLQEYTLASSKRIYWADECIGLAHNISYIKSAIQRFEREAWDYRSAWAPYGPELMRFMSSPGWRFTDTNQFYLSGYNLKPALDPNIAWKTSLNVKRRDIRRFQVLLILSRRLECNGLRDKVYALLGLCQVPIVVDYSQSEEQLFAQVLSILRQDVRSFHVRPLKSRPQWIVRAHDFLSKLPIVGWWSWNPDFRNELSGGVVPRERHCNDAIAAISHSLCVDQAAGVTVPGQVQPVPLHTVEPYASYLRLVAANGTFPLITGYLETVSR